MAQGFKMQKLVDEYKNIFLGKRGKRWNSSKPISVYFTFLKNGFEACQKPKSNLIKLEIMAQGFKMRKLIYEYKTIFQGKRGMGWNSSKIFSLNLRFV